MVAPVAKGNRGAESRWSSKPGRSNTNFMGIIYVFDITQPMLNECLCFALNCAPREIY